MLKKYYHNDMYIKTHRINVYLYDFKVHGSRYKKNHLRKMFTIDIVGFPKIQGLYFRFRFWQEIYCSTVRVVQNKIIK